MTSWIMMVGLSLLTVAQQPAPDAVTLLQQYSSERDTLTTMQARFTQWIFTPEEDLKSEGTVTFASPKRIIFRYDDPPLAYMIDDTHAYEYDEELEQIIIYDIEGQPEAEAFFLGMQSDISDIRDAYEVSILPEEPGEADFLHVQLIPHPDEELEPLFLSVTLKMRKSDFLPARILIRNDDDSRVEFTLTDFITNEVLPDDRTHIFVPERTDIVINDIALEPAGAEGRYFPERTASDEEQDTED
ncbi:MAG: outer membrane lipoprotein carrier protein LolA [Candidatus Hydrogenedentota bacterium]